MRRVVITGFGIKSPIGNDVESVEKSLLEGTSGISHIENWEKIKGLRPKVAGKLTGINPKDINRKHRRTMGNMAIYAALAAKDSTAHAGLEKNEFPI